MAPVWLALALGCSTDRANPSESPASPAKGGPPIALTEDRAAAFGATVTYSVSGARAGEQVFFVDSTAGEGAGPCMAKLGGKCLGILSPTLAGSAIADAGGVASLPIVLPSTGPNGTSWSVQAMVKRGAGGANSKLSAPLTEILPSLYLSGLTARPANPTCVAPAVPPVVAATADAVPAFPNLAFTEPTLLLQGPNDRWYVTEQAGVVRTFPDDDATLASTVFLDLSAIVYSVPGEMGLLGMAFAPDFEATGEVYLNYTTTDQFGDKSSQIVRYTSTDGGLTADPATAETVLTIAQPFVNHNGGNIVFGPDGYLYAGFGDGGSGGDPFDNGQNTGVLLGKMLRIDVDGGVPYAIPADNPFAAGGGAPEIYAWGLRNPWRWSFDSLTGDLWLADVGQDLHEELDRIERGGNYGWNRMEGFACYSDPLCHDLPGITEPVIDWPHPDGHAAIGGYVYRGSALPDLVGTYLFTDYHWPHVDGLFYGADGLPYHAVVASTGVPSHVSSFGQGNDGELYLVAHDGGTLWKLVPSAAPPPVDPFPRTLSATGCVDALDPSVPVAGMIPFEPNAPFWSDGADKERFLAIPDGTAIAIGADGDWDLPIGSVVLKTFRVNGVLAETRLLVRHADGSWAGYPYAWRADGTDADLVLGGTVVDAGGTSWRIPSSADCLECHTAVAGSTLGLENGQLNRNITYPSTGLVGNELTTFDTVGLLSAPLAPTPDQIAPWPDPYGAAPLEDRARSWLATNCSQCHQPGGPGGGAMDFRFDTPVADLGICNVAPSEGDAGVPGSLLLVPGDHANSVVSLRGHATDVWMMPPLGRATVDVAGTAVLDAWIDSLAACP